MVFGATTLKNNWFMGIIFQHINLFFIYESASRLLSNLLFYSATFSGYTTIPTIPTTQNQQTLVFSQLGVISSQPNILPTHSAPGNAVPQQKPQEMHKVRFFKSL